MLNISVRLRANIQCHPVLVSTNKPTPYKPPDSSMNKHNGQDLLTSRFAVATIITNHI